jgi:GH35 family endo-1,4-beta-xylanase
LKFMTSTTLYYNNYKRKKNTCTHTYLHKKELKKNTYINCVGMSQNMKTQGKIKKKKNDLK